MATEFVDLAQSPAELLRVFVALGLARENEVPVIETLTGGVSSGISRVQVSSGNYCLKQALPQLKVAKEWLVPVERVYAEIAWLKTVGEIVPGNVPKVLGQDDASKSFVMEYLPGNYRNWKAELLQGRAEPDVAQAVGDILGKIHAATAKSASLAERFATDDNFYAIRLEPYLVEAGRNNPDLSARLEQLVERTRNTRSVLVHGDVSPKNIMLGPDGPVLLDAECAWYGDPAFDLAFCLNHFLLKASLLPQALPLFMQSFRVMTTAYMARANFEPVDDLEHRTATLLPALTLARIDGKSPVEYLDESTRTRVRTASRFMLDNPSSRLEDISQFWIKEFSV